MPELSVAVSATDNDQRAVLQVLVDGTSVARTVCSNSTLPLAANDPVIRKTKTLAPDIVMVDIANNDATTVAVNLALALQSAQNNTALVDLAPLGHCALHLNLKPNFTISDAVTNLHRLDSSLLDSFMARHEDGLQILAGSKAPGTIEPSTSDFARLFDTIVGRFQYVVVDISSRLDSAARLVSNLSEKILLIAHADVASLWSAGRVAQYLGESGTRDRFALVLNRYRKVAGFNEAETEAAIGAPVLWRIPNQYFAVSTAIDRGIPVMQQGNSEIARSISELAEFLTKDDLEVKRTAWSLFKTV